MRTEAAPGASNYIRTHSMLAHIAMECRFEIMRNCISAWIDGNDSGGIPGLQDSDIADVPVVSPDLGNRIAASFTVQSRSIKRSLVLFNANVCSVFALGPLRQRSLVCHLGK